jgi:ribonuclease III
VRRVGGLEAGDGDVSKLSKAQNALLDTLEARLGMAFKDRALLLRAVTHHSMCPETAQRDAYDTLEFLGDALISAYVVEHLYHTFPIATEGELTALKSEVVSRGVFAQIGLGLGLMEFIRADPANLRTFNDRSRESLCADVLEALVGAIHLDAGRAAGEDFVSRFILPVIPQVRATLGERNPKGALQQHILRQTGQLPRYEVLEERGESNDRSYLVGVYAGERLLGRGEGSSIKVAGREAARAALSGEFPGGVDDEASPPTPATQ